MLLPPAFQDKTEFLPLGKAIKKPEPAKCGPVSAFERVKHDTEGPAPWDHIANRRAWAELNVEYDAEMAKARARLVEPAALKEGDVVTTAYIHGKTFRIADIAGFCGDSGFAGIPERKLDWPKLDHEAPRSPGNRLVPFEQMLKESLESVADCRDGRWYPKQDT